MKYIDYLKSLDIFNGIEITEELNYQYNGASTLIVIKLLSGTNFQNSKVQPIQLFVFTNDVVDTKSLLDIFTASYNNAPFTTDENEYIQQIYSTPMLVTAFDTTGNNYTHQFLVSGSLLVSNNVSEIKQVKIDNVLYETTQRVLSFSAQIDNQRVSSSFINTSQITYATIKFNCQMIHKNNTLLSKLRGIRSGVLSPNTTFAVKLIYNDNDVEETYDMKIDNFTLTSENQALPILSLSFIK
jgi:hypothetical protein